MEQMRVSQSINPNCPFSGKPVQDDSLTRYKDRVVGFCNPGCRDKFAANPAGFPDAVAVFDGLIAGDG